MIGVNSQIASSSRQSSGVGFAIAVDTVKQVVPQLIKGGEIQRAYLGVSRRARRAGRRRRRRLAGGPAAGTDLQTGRPDRRRSAAATVKNPSDLSTAVLNRKPGEHVTLTVDRNGQQRTIDVTLGTRPDQLQQG